MIQDTGRRYNSFEEMLVSDCEAGFYIGLEGDPRAHQPGWDTIRFKLIRRKEPRDADP